MTLRRLAFPAVLAALIVPMLGATITITGSFSAPVTITSPRSVVNVGGRACTADASLSRFTFVYMPVIGGVFPLPPFGQPWTNLNLTTKDRKGLPPITRVVVRFSSRGTTSECELAPAEFYIVMPPARSPAPQTRTWTGSFRGLDDVGPGQRGRYEMFVLSGRTWSRATIPSLEVRNFGF